MQALPTLPIVAALPVLAEALEAGRQVVLEAPPGAGKSTVVPLALLDAAWRGEGHGWHWSWGGRSKREGVGPW
jgi:ATP-dependent helicase HrpB